MTRRALFWPAVLLLAALYVFGFHQSKAFSQTIWRPLGVNRVWRFGRRCAFGFVVGVALFPAWLGRLVAAGALIHAAAIVGIAPAGAVLLFLAAAWAVGGAVAAGITGLLAGVGILAFLTGLLVHLPVNYPGVYVALFLTPIVWRRRVLFSALRDASGWIRIPQPVTRVEAAATGLLAAILLLHLLMVLQPETSSDGLSIHLATAAAVANHHEWNFDFRHTLWSLMPLTADWAYAAVFQLGGAASARLLNFAMLLAALVVLNGLLRQRLSRSVSLLFTALFASSPIVQLVTGSLFVENFWMAMLLGAFACIVRYRESGERREVWAAAVLLGTGLAAKYAAAAFVIPAAALMSAELWRRRAIRSAALPAALLVIFALPPYLKAFLLTGNPVFPFANTLFRSPYFQHTEPFMDPRFRSPLSVRTLYDATFHTTRFFEGQDGGWGFPYLFFLPLAVLFASRRAPYAERAALGLGLLFSILTFQGQANVRYLYPALPLFLIAGGGVVASAREDGRARFLTLIAAACLLLPLNVYFLPASGWQHKEFDRTSPDSIGQLVALLNRNHRGEPVYFIENHSIAGLVGRAYTASWHNNDFWRRLWEVDSARTALELVNKTHLRLFLAPVDPNKIKEKPWREFLRFYTEPIHKAGAWQATRLRADWARMPEVVLNAGTYDDTDPRIEYSGQWKGDRQFPSPANGTITYSGQAGEWFRIRFRGRGFTYVYTKASNRGRAEVRIDGRSIAVVDLHAAGTEWMQRSVFDGLTPGEHTVEVRVTGSKNERASEAFVDLDQVIIAD